MSTIDWRERRVRRNDRLRLNRQESVLIWLTGLSGAGRSTLAYGVERFLFERGFRTYVLDDDNVRFGLCGDIGANPGDYGRAARRVAEVGRLFVDAGIMTMAAVISPHREDRQFARKLFRTGEFIEVYVKCSLSECRKRDPRGEYQQLRSGRMTEYARASSLFEEPDNPELVLETDSKDPDACITDVVHYLVREYII